MKLTVVDEAGKKTESEIEVSDVVFGTAFNEPLVHQVVVAYQANARAGTRAQKARSEVRGGGRKPWRQKGTGRARAGTIRSPLWRGGGKIFPSSPNENFSQKINRKMYRGAMRAILSELIRQGRLVAVPDFKVEVPKTKVLASRLEQMDAADALIVTEAADEHLERAARNLPKVDVRTASSVDPVSLIAFEKVIVTAGALRRLEERLS